MKNNMRHSTGEHHYFNGDTYNGEWLNDKRIGTGRIQQADGAKIECMFIEDKDDGNVVMDDAEGNQYKSV